MKPELIFINEKNGMVTLSKEDLENIVERAYRAGQIDNTTITTQPWQINPVWKDQAVPVMRKTDITCHEGNWAEGTQTR